MAGQPDQQMPFFSFGIISDVQYADREDGYNYMQTQKRYYRGALQGLRRAVASWVDHRDSLTRSTTSTPFFVLQLGDLLDGCNAANGGAEQALSLMLAELEGLDVHHVIGNHEMYCYNRAELLQRLPSFKREQRFYYSFSPHPRFRFVNLDSYDVSAMGAEDGTEEHRLAMGYLSKNPNDDKQSPLGLWGTDRRLVKFNGGLGPRQIGFLKEALEDAMRQGQWAIIFHHIPVHPESCVHETLLWNYEEVLAVLHTFPNVVATLSGHTHEHCIYRDEKGIVHHVSAAPLECPPGVDAFSTAVAYEDRIIIQGFGVHETIEILCRPFQPLKTLKS